MLRRVWIYAASLCYVVQCTQNYQKYKCTQNKSFADGVLHDTFVKNLIYIYNLVRLVNPSPTNSTNPQDFANPSYLYQKVRLVKLEQRVRDCYVPHPLFMSFQVGYNLILEEIFMSKKKCL